MKVHPEEARQIAERAANLTSEVLCSHGIAHYATELFFAYARLDAERRRSQPPLEPARHVRFHCRAGEGDGQRERGLLLCSFAA